MTIIRKIKNKNRPGFRGKKLRYSVWRACNNKTWEIANESMARRICEDNDLNVEEHLSAEKRNKWEHTYDDLRKKGYYANVSIKEMIGDSGLLDELAS